MIQTRDILGLDLGVTSVGWALLRVFFEQREATRYEIIATGVRIFPATTEGAQNEPKNRARRLSRGARRLLRRKGQRRRKVKSIFESNGLFPTLNDNSETVFNALGDPYELRSRGTREKLTPYEIGRALLHLIKRRGFKSNRKKGKSKDDGVVYSGIGQTREEMRNGEFVTLGSLLHQKEKKRGYYTAREMIEDEFDQIWRAQSPYYPEILTEDLRTQIRNIAFYPGQIRSQRGLIGKCRFENGKKRCDMARQDAQRIRYWQDINYLKLQDRRTLECEGLTHDQKTSLARALENLKKQDFSESDLRTVLNIDSNFRINLEKKIKGNTTAYKFRRAIGLKWDAFSPEDQERLTEEYIRIEDEKTLERRLYERWKFTNKEIEKLIKIELEPGYSRCSLKAISKILPKMMEGLSYDKAATAIYGDHRGTAPSGDYDQLPPPPSDLRNPIVKKALNEMRKVINAIIREYGKPSEIRLEMARDLKLTKKQKDRTNAQNKKNELANKEAVDFYVKLHGVDPDSISGTNKLKYRLAKEANWICPYTNDPIPPHSLLGDEWDKEHIIPYSRCFDDSYMNLTICRADYNRKTKLNKTPFELFGHDEQAWFELGERIADLPFAKRRRFEQKEVDEEKMVNRMLSDTRYICREARGYLRQLYPPHQDENKYVQVVAGGSTHKLRESWGLNAILSEGDMYHKNRDDHRHHAIDAIVIALTDRALFQKISKLASRNEQFHRRELKGIDMPWEGFRDDVKNQIDSLIVSHAPTRRIRGSLFKDTALGRRKDGTFFVRRKSLNDSSFTLPMVERIVDKEIKKLVRARLAEFDGNLKKAFGKDTLPFLHKDGKTPIESVRIHETMSEGTYAGIKNSQGEEYKFYALDGNHHVDIFENADGGRKAILVQRFYAAKRGWNPAGIGSDWRKLFSLSANDYVEFLGDDGKLRIYRVQKMSGGGNVRVDIRPLEDARTEYISGTTFALTSSAALKKITRKLQVDPLGRLSQAND